MNNILFFGTYQHKVDSKGRVSIPAEWRKHLINNEIFIFNDGGFGFNSIDSFKSFLGCKIMKDELQYKPYFSNFYKYNLDTEGRAVFKTEKGKTAILKGCGDYFTIEFRLDNYEKKLV